MSSIVLAVLWGVVLWRLPAAWQTSWKRAPWVALAALAVALTLDLPAVTTGIDRLAGITLIAVLLKLARQELAEYRHDKTSALKLISVGEAKRNPKLDPAELAAWTTVASTILNMDETITKE